ncbi:hypothetical protein TVAG_044390 [Trichomonas vaginalis G3]|uniref:Uncharacterized protein n=1 Tax=Trichomonas vaginalis (strain ATCC PRA-98 / G3) TaxID=412133 RepID=A2E0J7_TRIV3|nr:hypothetical protein TVAGG3_0549890 [Trichomonas vaginalis G3]EAY13877.1 hypothetical protein TVAG_044390 [Trichomonas vaginalis G3]KAI5520421.1 hypothetical protein TVAGG3_0549890 [Trichomonas vaginalis G3]|eukprot:XP_001326100.1 hypothetical protein [Trichomonas vaginalis G3]
MLSKGQLYINNRENELEINRLKFEIEDAISRRDYATAASLQKDLDNRVERRRRMLAGQKHDNTVSELMALKEQQRQEEFQLRESMRAKARKILTEASQRLEEIEKEHTQQYAKLDRKFSDQTFVQLRRNPDLTIARKAEWYYSQSGNYAVAASLRDQISDRISETMENNERTANQIVNTEIETTLFKQERQKESFKVHLENEKNRLVREAILEMYRIENKYSKLRQHILGNSKIDYQYNRERKIEQETNKVREVLDEEFNMFKNNITLIGIDPHPPMSSRAPQSARFSTMHTPRTPRVDSEEFRSNGIRNPRVIKALEKSLMKREYAVINSASPITN